MRIRVFPCDLEGSGCYRVIYPYGMIDAYTEHSVDMAAQMGDDRMLLPIPPGMVGYSQTVEGELEVEMFMDSDVYVFQRPMEKLYPGVIMKLKLAGKKVVVELDDYMHGVITPTPKAGLAKAKKRSSVQALSLCVAMADLVTVSSQALADQYRKMNPNVVVLRNRLRYNDFKEIEPSFIKDRPEIRIGWMGLMDYRANDLSLLKPWLNRFLKRHPEVTFVNVGSKKALDYLCVPKDRRMHFESVTFPGHLKPTSEIDIGLVPLTTNTFNECKSYLKGMEYGAVGAAVLASPTDEYNLWINETWNGVTATDDFLEEALEWLVENDNWRRCAEENHRKARENTIEDHYKEWLTTLCSLLSLPSPAIGSVTPSIALGLSAETLA